MIVSSWSELIKTHPEVRELKCADALEAYLSSGGILNIEEGTFRIVYPTRKVLESRIRDLERRRSFLLSQIRKLKKKRKAAPTPFLLFDPLFIEHSLRCFLDSGYRKDYGKLGFDRTAFLHEKTRKIIREFMRNDEYRRNVLEAISQSPVYRRKGFSSAAYNGRRMREELISSRISQLEKAVEKIEREIAVLSVLKKWCA